MFKEFNITERMVDALRTQEFVKPTDIQSLCIPAILEGRDIIGKSQTGSGKTLAYAIPAIERIDLEQNAVQVLVLCPTRELVVQVAEEMRKLTQTQEGLKVVTVYGGADIKRQIQSLKRAKIVIATPGRLNDHIRRKTIHLDEVKLAVLDEADEMLDMGFREDIEKILRKLPETRQTVMFSATMPAPIKSIANTYMNAAEYLELAYETLTVQETDEYVLTTSMTGKKQGLIKLFEVEKPESAIIFCNTKRMTDDVNNYLNARGIDSIALHGDMRQSERKRVMGEMKNGSTTTLVATDIAARGIDIKNIAYVINFDLPQDAETYVHRIGRTGRAGKSGKAVTIINDREQYIKLTAYQRVTKSEIQVHPLSENPDMYTKKRDSRYYSDRKRTNALNPRGMGRRR